MLSEPGACEAPRGPSHAGVLLLVRMARILGWSEVDSWRLEALAAAAPARAFAGLGRMRAALGQADGTVQWLEARA